ncbi:beta-ketoacyl synthase [Pseudomonas sp. SDI]|uniref:beta-ketoacyl synthase n=1 Tax=Pseudomonas sp. SDI TaxID=2170734 RepID=UPI000DE69073|nr:beta-ketoacyl synthase [Pseudomonas sp. SDI]PWB35344.1 beta-ketoacyl synthase [Pseudomonas sp. SDI]
MYASNQRPVYLRAATVLNAAGDHCADLLHAAPAPQPLSFDASREAFCLGTPKLAGKVFERKILRGLEPQGLRILHCAAGLAEALAALELPAQRIVLTAAIPEVDGPSTSWEAVQAILEQPEQLLVQFMAHTPPMHALTLLNSSVMAYVAQGLGCRGAMGGFCSQSNAGVDALAEAFHSLAEGRGDAALVVGSSPNISPALYLREPAQAQRLYGEGAAALLLSHRASADALRIAGIARGYSANASQAAAVAGRVIAQALRAERLTLGDVQQVVCDRRDPLVVSLFGPEQTLLDSLQPRVGDLGAGQLLSEAALALYRQQHAAQPVAYTLLLDRSQAGHWGAVLLAAPAKEAV